MPKKELNIGMFPPPFHTPQQLQNSINDLEQGPNSRDPRIQRYGGMKAQAEKDEAAWIENAQRHQKVFARLSNRRHEH